MRLAILSSLCLLGSTIAAPLDLSRRDLAIITYNVKRVNDAMKILDNSLKRKPGRDPASQTSFFSAVIPMNRQVVQELQQGAADVRRGPTINEIESLQLTAQFAPMLSSLRAIMNEWIAVKPFAVQIGAQKAILDGLIAAQGGTSMFSDAVISKQNLLNQAIGQGIKNQITGLLDKAITEYKKR